MKVNDDNKKYCERCSPIQCPNCSSFNRTKVDNNCPHETCIECFDQCKECYKTSKICIHCDESLILTPLFPCNHWDSCKNCTSFHHKCINCGNYPQKVKFSCGHFACKNCVDSYCRVCIVPSNKICSVCNTLSKPYKMPDSLIICTHYQCYGCANGDLNCRICFEKETRNDDQQIIKKKYCESCNQIKYCSDLIQNCSHVLCNDCVYSCRHCFKICMACEHKTEVIDTCQNNHYLCRSCSQNKAQCILCSKDKVEIGSSTQQNTYINHSTQNSKTLSIHAQRKIKD